MPGFITTGRISTTATGSEWAAVRSRDGHPFLLKVVRVPDVALARALASQQMTEYDRIGNEHLVRRHGAVATADGRLALILDEVSGGSLAQLLGARGRLTAGETVTTLAPLFRALADLHAAGVVHGDLAPGNILFSADGRPLISDLGVSCLLGMDAGPFDASGSGTGTGAGTGTGTGTGMRTGTGSGKRTGFGAVGFSAPELAGGAVPSPVSDVYAMAALGWFCLTGAAPAPAAVRRSLTSLRPDIPRRLAEVLTACLATNPAARASASTAAVEVFEAAPAESVALAPVSDPAAEITRRIRAVAASASVPTPRPIGKRYQAEMVVGVVALLVVLLGAGATWFFRRSAEASTPISVRSAAHRPSLGAATPRTSPSAAQPPLPLATMPVTMRTSLPTTVAPKEAAKSPADVLTASSSPRLAAADLLQALADARALAYVTRSSALLDLVYAPGATKADVDKANIAAALKNDGTYLGLSFVIRDVAYLAGTSDTARVRATILTPAYTTGQPDGRRISHPQEILGPCIFSLSFTPDGWRILALTAP